MKPGPDIQAKIAARDPANGFYARKPECVPDYFQGGETAEQWRARDEWLDTMTFAEAKAITAAFYRRKPNPDDDSDDADPDEQGRAYGEWISIKSEAEVYAFSFTNKVKRKAAAIMKAKAEGRELREYVPLQTEEGHREKTAMRAVKFRANQKATETPEEKIVRQEKERLKKAAQRAKAKAERSVI